MRGSTSNAMKGQVARGLVAPKDRLCCHGVSYNDDSVECPRCNVEVVEE